jgi:HEAT repeat protein
LALTTPAIVVCSGQEIGSILPTPTLVPGDRSVSELIQGLKSEDVGVRRRAIFDVGRVGPEARDAVPALIEILLSEEEEYVRQAAAHSLGRIGPDARAAIPALTKAL